MSREAMQIALYTLNTSKRSHYYCEDNFYSCPKHEDGCANDMEGDECNCGANFVNETIEKAIEALLAALAQPEKIECSRSHPHENMGSHCQLRTEIARLTNENARLKVQPESEPVAIVQQEAYGRGQVLWVQPASTVPDGTPLYTAPPEHKQLFKNVHSVNRNRDMSITLVFKSCASASEFFKEANIKENNK